MDCPFCYKIENIEPVLENDLAYAFYDEFPVSKGHMLFITKRHADDFFDITEDERTAIFNLVDDAKRLIDNEFKPDGYNIGCNIGHAAGQTVNHMHLHLIPRYNGDVLDPKGGIRGVIPDKKDY